jgi:hypothetical protein
VTKIGRKIVVVAAAALFVAGGGTAVAAVMSGSPVDNSGVIHGCWSDNAIKGSHVFVLQDAGTTCPKGTTAISWNQAGASGPAGPQGPPGVVGEVYRQNSVSFPVGLTPPGIETVSVSCPQGDVATGGGFALSGPMGIGGNATEKWIPVFDDATTPNGVPSGWEVGLTETGTPGDISSNYVLNSYVYCAPTS